MHAYIHTYIHTCIYIYIYIYTYIHAYTHIPNNTYIRTIHTYTPNNTYIHTLHIRCWFQSSMEGLYFLTYFYTHTRNNTYIHTHIHITYTLPVLIIDGRIAFFNIFLHTHQTVHTDITCTLPPYHKYFGDHFASENCFSCTAQLIFLRQGLMDLHSYSVRRTKILVTSEKDPPCCDVRGVIQLNRRFPSCLSPRFQGES